MNKRRPQKHPLDPHHRGRLLVNLIVVHLQIIGKCDDRILRMIQCIKHLFEECRCEDLVLMHQHHKRCLRQCHRKIVVLDLSAVPIDTDRNIVAVRDPLNEIIRRGGRDQDLCTNRLLLYGTDGLLQILALLISADNKGKIIRGIVIVLFHAYFAPFPMIASIFAASPQMPGESYGLSGKAPYSSLIFMFFSLI